MLLDNSNDSALSSFCTVLVGMPAAQDLVVRKSGEQAREGAGKKKQRRQYGRSRHGCFLCKQRHISCDERRPAW
jgi:hypothetical protein